MKLFALYFSLLLFYIKLSFGFWITWILKKENPKIELFPTSADLALDNMSIYIYIYIYVWVSEWVSERVCVCVIAATSNSSSYDIKPINSICSNLMISRNLCACIFLLWGKRLHFHPFIHTSNHTFVLPSHYYEEIQGAESWSFHERIARSKIEKI